MKTLSPERKNSELINFPQLNHPNAIKLYLYRIFWCLGTLIKITIRNTIKEYIFNIEKKLRIRRKDSFFPRKNESNGLGIMSLVKNVALAAGMDGLPDELPELDFDLANTVENAFKNGKLKKALKSINSLSKNVTGIEGAKDVFKTVMKSFVDDENGETSLIEEIFTTMSPATNSQNGENNSTENSGDETTSTKMTIDENENENENDSGEDNNSDSNNTPQEVLPESKTEIVIIEDDY